MEAHQRPLVAILILTPNGRNWPGQRPSRLAVATSPARLHLGLFGDLQRIVNLDPELPDGPLRNVHLAYQRGRSLRRN